MRVCPCVNPKDRAILCFFVVECAGRGAEMCQCDRGKPAASAPAVKEPPKPFFVSSKLAKKGCKKGGKEKKKGCCVCMWGRVRHQQNQNTACTVVAAERRIFAAGVRAVDSAGVLCFLCCPHSYHCVACQSKRGQGRPSRCRRTAQGHALLVVVADETSRGASR